MPKRSAGLLLFRGTPEAIGVLLVQAFSAVRSGSPAIHTGTPGAARTYAMVTAAMYDAVNGIDRAQGASNLKQWLISADDAPAGGNREHAAAAAAHAVLVGLFPARQGTLDAALAPDCSVPITDSSEAGCKWGDAAGQAVFHFIGPTATKI